MLSELWLLPYLALTRAALLTDVKSTRTSMPNEINAQADSGRQMAEWQTHSTFGTVANRCCGRVG